MNFILPARGEWRSGEKLKLKYEQLDWNFHDLHRNYPTLCRMPVLASNKSFTSFDILVTTCRVEIFSFNLLIWVDLNSLNWIRLKYDRACRARGCLVPSLSSAHRFLLSDFKLSNLFRWKSERGFKSQPIISNCLLVVPSAKEHKL